MNREAQVDVAAATPPDSAGSNNAKVPAKRAPVSRSQASILNPQRSTNAGVALLTGGGDRPYALGLSSALAEAGVQLDLIGSSELDCPEVRGNPRIHFLNLRGDQSVDAGPLQKISRVLVYYFRLLAYAASARPKIFHILWNNKFEFFDRTLLMLYYKLLGKKIVFTAHNVNAGKRDANDSFLNRLSLKIQYRLSDHIFVHTEKMRAELASQFGVTGGKTSVIPFGINNTVPNTELTPGDARRHFGIRDGEKTLLFFGNIAPYKGLDYLVAAFIELSKKSANYRLIIAGRPKECEDYWSRIQQLISSSGMEDRVIQRIEYVPDEQTELYFKAADILVLPYTHVFQSGVLFLGYGFGLPVIAADVGSLKEEIIGGNTGFVFRPQDASDLANTIEQYFACDLYRNLDLRRQTIREYANKRYSWTTVGETTRQVYSNLLAV